MKHSPLSSLLAAALVVAVSNAQADDMEKCTIVDKNGKGLIKAHKADCKSLKHSCAGSNAAGDSTAWIYVPKGMCDKIQQGDYTGVPQNIKDKIEGA